MTELVAQLAQNLDEVRGRIAESAKRSGRRADDVRLVAVTKYAGLDVVRALVAAGGQLLGESRPQQLWDRAAALNHLDIRWHLIGHLQKNKVRRTLPVTAMIQSVDSAELAAAIDRIAAEEGRMVPVLLEVNISGEPAKHGFSPAEIEPFVAQLSDYPRLEVRGLMAMAGLAGGLDEARRQFAAVRQLRDHLQSSAVPAVRLDELSMGMSGDYEVAVEEGATIVRVGSALFEGVAA